MKLPSIVRFREHWWPYEPGDIVIPLYEIPPDPLTDGKWILLGKNGVFETMNGPGIYVDEFWEEIEQ